MGAPILEMLYRSKLSVEPTQCVCMDCTSNSMARCPCVCIHVCTSLLVHAPFHYRPSYPTDHPHPSACKKIFGYQAMAALCMYMYIIYVHTMSCMNNVGVLLCNTPGPGHVPNGLLPNLILW